MPRRKNILTTVTRLGKRYDQWKKYEGKKNEEKDEFFELATAQEAQKTLATKTVEISPARSEEEARSYLAKYYPRWNVSGLLEGEEEGLFVKAAIEENPAFKDAVVVNPRDGRVYARSVVDGPALLDDERLKAEDLALYESITFKTPWDEQILWPLDQLSEEKIGALTDYIYHDKPRIKLLPPRKAKPEELG